MDFHVRSRPSCHLFSAECQIQEGRIAHRDLRMLERLLRRSRGEDEIDLWLFTHQDRHDSAKGRVIFYVCHAGWAHTHKVVTISGFGAQSSQM